MKQTIVAVMLCLMAPARCTADHLPANLLNHGKPETTLARIDLEKTSLNQALSVYGPPTQTVRVPNNPDWTGYLWDNGGFRLEVEVGASSKKAYIDRVTIVRTGKIENTSPETESTGAGLKLGDGLDTLKRIYGTRLQIGRQENVPVSTKPFLALPGSRTVMVQWTPLEFTFMAGFDERGQIVAMSLRPPECYPGGCQ